MTTIAFQMNPNDPAFWVMVIVAVSFFTIAIAMIVMAMYISRAVKSVNRLEQRLEPLLEKLNFVGEQSKQISVQGKLIAEQFNVVAGHVSNATLHVSESLALIKSEVAELKEIVSHTAVEAREKVDLVSRTIDHTQNQVITTTEFIQERVIAPAREVAAIMSGFRRGLEVLLAPAPKPINTSYGEDEMFIG
jgi:uncharacterized protein YoxC